MPTISQFLGISILMFWRDHQPAHFFTCVKRLFRAVRVDPLLRTVAWPNGADLAPEFLAERLERGGRSAAARFGYPTAGRHALAVLETPPRYGARRKATRKSKNNVSQRVVRSGGR